MLHYLNNNFVLIKEYQTLYSDGVQIDTLLEKFRTEEMILHDGFDYGRFRVFLDSCLLLLNKEKLNQYYKDKYSFKAFLNHEAENNVRLTQYCEYIKNARLAPGICLYHSLENGEKTPWNQVMTIRNAMAHMQYGNFSYQENGTMIYYWL